MLLCHTSSIKVRKLTNFLVRPKRLSPPAGQARTPWDPDLLHAMLSHLAAVEEEIVMDLLLADLATGIAG